MIPYPSQVSSDYSRAWIQRPILAFLAVAVLVAGLAGCGSVPLTKGLTFFSPRRDIVANWDDADPAVEVALHQVQMALVHKEREEGDLERRYELLTHTDE